MGFRLFSDDETVIDYEIKPNHERIFTDLKIGSYEIEMPEGDTLKPCVDRLQLTPQDIENLRYYLSGNNFNELKFEWEYAKKKLKERIPSERQTVDDLLLELTPNILETQYDYRFLETISLIVAFADKHKERQDFLFIGERSDLKEQQASPSWVNPWESGAD
ncbi:hypothetical protein LSG31_19260 [Fodinisporobacter ferrooxydans]|uniref:Uncharacterized protein n=1 Tax=Fodinisporobacter ferrooxydans TaxID=2901836 RepID=A0ABY4CHI4_9BACL|nr:hypothetical protein LSG31_19260 [Alicyclobacillaceae bacterium MYW30-H2]